MAILTTVTLSSTNNALPDDDVTAPKHIGAVLMLILIYIFKTVFKTVHLCVSWRMKKTLKIENNVSLSLIVQGGSNMTGTDLCVNKPHCAAAMRP